MTKMCFQVFLCSDCLSAMRLESGTPLQQEVGWTRDLLRTVRYLANTEDDPFIVCSLNNVEDQLKLWTNTFPSIEPTHGKVCSLHWSL